MMPEGVRRLIEAADQGGSRRTAEAALAAVEKVTGAPGFAALLEDGRMEVRASAGLEPPTEEMLLRIAHADGPGDTARTPADEPLEIAASVVADGLAVAVGSSAAGQAKRRFEEWSPVVLTAMARGALLAHSRRRATEVERLNVTAQRVASFLDLESVLSQLVRDAVELVGASSGDVVLLDERTSGLRVVAVANLPDSMVGFVLEEGEGVSPRAMEARRTIIVANYAHYRHRVRRLDAYGFRAIVSAPLIARGEAIGVLNVHTREDDHSFTRADARLLTTFANHAAIAIDNARRYDNEARLAHDLSRANAELARSLTLQQRLAEQVLLDRGPEAVVSELASLLGQPVVLQDEFFRVIAGAGGNSDGAWRRLAISRASASEPPVARFLEHVDATGRPAASPPEVLEPARVVAPLRAGTGTSGYLILGSRELEDLDRALVEVASTGVALEMAKLRTRIEVESRIRGDALGDLLAGTFASDESIAARASRLGYDLSQPRDLVVLSLDTRGDLDDAPAPQRKLAEHAAGVVADLAPGAITHRHGDTLVILASAGADPSTTVVVDALLARLATDAGADSLTAALGETCSAPGDYAASYRLARQALEASLKLGRRGGIVDARGLGVARLLVGSSNPEELAAFAMRLLGPLLQPSEHARSLLRTLRTYVDVGFNQRETARRAFVHINTVAYRLRRVEKILGVDLGDPDTKMDVTFALRIAHLFVLDDNSVRPALS